MDQAPPEAVKWALLIGVPFLIAFLGVWAPITFVLRPTFLAKAVAGIRFRFLPLKKLYFTPDWANLDEAFITKFVENYSTSMPSAYYTIGVATTPEEIRQRISRVICTVRLGALHDPTRKDDLNFDGKKDTITGLTHSPFDIEVGVLPDMLENGKLMIDRTAFTYELHNAVIQALVGYEVSIAESFVGNDDPRLLPYVGHQPLAVLKSKRAALDAMFATIK